jgi:uncharacterized YigZ family protein
MKYIKDIFTHQIEIDKSIFIGILFPLQSSDDVKNKIEKAKQMFPKANHYCSASLSGEGLEHATSSDDGEPSRTAGVPILEVLKHHGVTDILCVVVRYFGGVKLGAGGLIRAYARASSEVLKQATFYEKKEMKGYEIVFSYALIQKIDYLLDDISMIKNKTYEKDVTYRFYFKDKDIEVLDDIKHQLISIKPLKSETLFVKI